MNDLDILTDLYKDCTLCPNNCAQDRTQGKKGVCGETSRVRVAWAGLHRGEEPPISGDKGSGMIFFTGCPLHCAYCQNYQISTDSEAGFEVSIAELSNIMLELQKTGAETLNLVTGTHFVPSIIDALNIAENQGFKLPVVWNSSGYESVSTLRLIDPYIDLYLLDVKTLSEKVASVFCGRACYADAILPVMRFLKRRYSKTTLEKGALSGVLVRHLVFPGCLEATKDFLKWYADNFKENFYLSLMTQFVPPKGNSDFKLADEDTYSELFELVDALEIDGFIQEPDGKDALWIPDFTEDNPFPESFADPLPYFLKLKRNFQI